MAAFLAGCEAPLSTLDPAGPIAGRIAALWWLMLAGAALILTGICLLALLPFVDAGRLRRVSPKLWLWGGGLVFPLTVLAALLFHTFAFDPPDKTAAAASPPVRVTAIGRQWEWVFVHNEAPGGALTTQGRLHIPAGQPVEIVILSEDVIHSFWVPRLAGKLDAIPGRVNRLTLVADRPGTYGGVCNEFCGLGHAAMSFEVVAHEAGDYANALAGLAAGQRVPDEDRRRGAKP